MGISFVHIAAIDFWSGVQTGKAKRVAKTLAHAFHSRGFVLLNGVRAPNGCCSRQELLDEVGGLRAKTPIIDAIQRASFRYCFAEDVDGHKVFCVQYKEMSTIDNSEIDGSQIALAERKSTGVQVWRWELILNAKSETMAIFTSMIDYERDSIHTLQADGLLQKAAEPLKELAAATQEDPPESQDQGYYNCSIQ